MRITDIKITNYRAFYGEHHICLDKDGKNLMLYGENGSGKSSLFTAMKDFFLASAKKLPELEENIFLPASKKNTAKIEVTLKENPDSSKSTVFELNTVQKEIISADKTLISDANKIKGFFDYRNLLKTHLNHKAQVDLFEIIVGEILYHSINRGCIANCRIHAALFSCLKLISRTLFFTSLHLPDSYLVRSLSIASTPVLAHL